MALASEYDLKMLDKDGRMGLLFFVIINIKVTLATQLQYSSPWHIERLVGRQRMHGLKLVIKNYMKLGRYVTGGNVQDQRNLRRV
jgi:hypothetical protein